MNFFAELKRRNVYKVAAAYIVAGWALSQGIAQVFPVFDVTNWVIRSIVVMIILGLPVALVLAWSFEITPRELSAPKRPTRCRRPRDERSTSGFTSRSSAHFYRLDYFFSDATALETKQPHPPAF